MSQLQDEEDYSVLEPEHISDADRVIYTEKRLRSISANEVHGARVRAELLKELKSTMGNITESCERVGITPSAYYKHLERHPEFRLKVLEIEDMQIDFAESALFRQIAEGNVSSTQFFLKHKGHRRGYVSKPQVEVEQNLNVSFSYSTTKSEKLEEIKEIMTQQLEQKEQEAQDGYV